MSEHPAPTNPAIQYLTGDATRPAALGPAIICHVCNDIGAWGKGFVLALSRRWTAPEREFTRWSKGETCLTFGLGQVQVVQVEPNLWVANMVAQHGIRPLKGVPPIRYEALRDCLERIATVAANLGATIHMPRIGCGLAGGDWLKVSEIIESTLVSAGMSVAIYDLPPASNKSLPGK